MNRSLDTRRVLADSTLVGLATASGGAFLFVANLHLARLFGPVEFGRLRTVIELMSSLTLIVELGAGPSLVKYISEHGIERTRDLARRILTLRAVLFVALASAVFLGRDTLAGWTLEDAAGSAPVDPLLGHYVAAGALYLLLVYVDICKFLVLAYQKIRLFALSIATTFLANGALAAAFATFGGVVGAILGWGLGYVVGNAVSLVHIVRSGTLRKGPPMELRKVLWGYGLPMQVEQTLRGAEMAIIPIFSLFFAGPQIGALAFALVFYRSGASILTSISSTLMPRFGQLSSDPAGARSTLRQVLALYTPCAILAAGLGVLFAEPVIAAIDTAYLPAASILSTLAVYGALSGYGIILGFYFAGIGKVRWAIVTTGTQQAGLFLASYLGLMA